MAKECNRQCVYVRWIEGDVIFDEKTGLESTSGGKPQDCIPPKENPKDRLKQKGKTWREANSGWEYKCPEDKCNPSPCKTTDLDWKTVGEKDIDIEDQWEEECEIGNQKVKCTFKAKGTIKMEKERGTAECWPKKIAMAIGVIQDDVLICSERHAGFSTEVLNKIGKIIEVG